MGDRKDEGGGGEPLDKVLSKLDALGARMDALEVGGGSKNPLKADKGRKDEFPPKEAKDDEFPPPKEKDDDEDEDEDKEKKPFPPKADKKKDDEGEGGGEADPDKKPPPIAADKKKDEFPPPKADKKKDDDDEDEDEDDKKKKEKDDDAKADSVQILKRQVADQNREIARLAALMRPRSDDEHAAFADIQAKADSVFAGFGKRASRPLEGESLLRYRKRLATELKPYSPRWQKVKFSQLPDEAFTVAEEMVYADAAEAAANPTDLGEGELREVSRTDPRSGQKTIMFYGKDSFVKSMGRPARRVTSFRTQSAV